jgi:hypothetical protein
MPISASKLSGWVVIVGISVAATFTGADYLKLRAELGAFIEVQRSYERLVKQVTNLEYRISMQQQDASEFRTLSVKHQAQKRKTEATLEERRTYLDGREPIVEACHWSGELIVDNVPLNERGGAKESPPLSCAIPSGREATIRITISSDPLTSLEVFTGSFVGDRSSSGPSLMSSTNFRAIRYDIKTGSLIGSAEGVGSVALWFQTVSPVYGAIETLAHIGCEWPNHTQQCRVFVQMAVETK